MTDLDQAARQRNTDDAGCGCSDCQDDCRTPPGAPQPIALATDRTL